MYTKTPFWTLTTDDPITIGSTALNWQQSTAFSYGNVNANGTAVLANVVGDTLTLSAGTNISITGNATAKSVTIGVTGLSLNSISNGTSNVNVTSSGGNVAVGVGGTGNIAVFATTGEYVTGVVSASGNITGGNITTGGILSAVGNAYIGAGQVSANATTGALVVNGGVGINGNLFTTGTSANIVAGATSNVTINIGTGVPTANTATINIGTAAGSGNYSTSNINIGSGGGGGVNIGGNFSTNSGYTQISNNTGTITLGLATAATVSGSTKTIQIGTNGLANSISNIQIGTGAAANSNVIITIGPTLGVGNAYFNSGTPVTISNTLSVIGNTTSGNVLTAGLISATSTITSAANISGGNILTGGTVSSTGNITGGNISATAYIGTSVSVTGTVTSASVVGGVITGTSTSVTGTTAAASVVGGVITGTSVSTSGNITGGNINTSGIASVSNNLVINSPSPQAEGGQIILAWANISGITGQTNSTWNIDVDNTAALRMFYQNAVGATSVLLQASPSSNVLSFPSTAGVSATGNVTAPYFVGNGSALTGIIAAAGASIVNGNSNVVVASNGNVTIGVGGTASVETVANTGVYVSGVVSATGNITTAGNVVATGNLYYSGNILVARSLTVGTRATAQTIPLTAGGNLVLLTRAGNTNVQVTT